jgi:hypothetical protein
MCDRHIRATACEKRGRKFALLNFHESFFLSFFLVQLITFCTDFFSISVNGFPFQYLLVNMHIHIGVEKKEENNFELSIWVHERGISNVPHLSTAIVALMALSVCAGNMIRVREREKNWKAYTLLLAHDISIFKEIIFALIILRLHPQ